MITINQYKEMWNNIPSSPEGNLLRRVDDTHPLDLFIGFDEENRMMLVLFTDHLPKFCKSSKEILVRAIFREDKIYVARFSLTDNIFKDVFITLTWDILNFTYPVADIRRGITMLLDRFSMWQKLMEQSKAAGKEVKGLIGELLVLRDYCFPKFGISASINAWGGPLGTDRDFEYENAWIEVKTISLSAHQIQISSLEQLDTLADGLLVVCRLEKSSIIAPETITLQRLILSLESALVTEPDALHVLRTMIQLTGYDEHDDEYMPAFSFHRFETYRVTHDFPRIRRTDVPREVVGGSYFINIPMIQNWREE